MTKKNSVLSKIVRYPSTLILTVLVFVSSPVYAVGGFKCTIKEILVLGDDGTLDIGVKEWHRTANKRLIGKNFVIDRSTGLVTGAGLVFGTSSEMPAVYDYRPKENPYTAVSVIVPNMFVEIIEIDQWKEQPLKPFIYKQMDGEMLTGLCEPY